MEDLIRWTLIALSIPLLVALIVHTLKRARTLSERIDEYHAEQDAAKSTPGPINPYQDMAEVFGPTDEKIGDSGDKNAE